MRLALLLVCALSSACIEYETLTVAGQERRYLVHAPRTTGAPMPLVIAMHGGGGADAASFQRYIELDAVADDEGFAVVYPNAKGENWNDGRTGRLLVENAAGTDDVAFLSALIDHLAARMPLDLDRIYATGHSNGGGMSLRLGCELADRIAAIAPVSNSLAEPLRTSCEPSRPISVLLIHGTEDGYIPYAGGDVIGAGDRGRVLGVDATVALFAAHDACGPPVTTVTDNAADGTKLLRTRYEGCAAATEVVSDRLEGGGHTWPGVQRFGDFALGVVSDEYEGSRRIWEFLSTQRRTL